MLHLTSKGSHNRSKGDKSNERSEYSHIGFGDFFRKKLLRSILIFRGWIIDVFF